MSAFTPHDICAWAGRQVVGGAKRKAVLNALALFADRMTWECWPSFALIAQYTEIAERTVSRAVAELERDGFIARERIRRRDGSLGGWRFRLNPQGVETVIPGRPGAAEGEDEEAEEALAGDGEPPAKLAGGDQDDGERPRNDTQDIEGYHPPTRPGGENTTVVKLASPPATGGGSKELPLGTTTSPLPPSAPAPAACLPDGQASGVGETFKAPTDPPAEKFRRAVLSAFGAGWFGAWFEEAAITPPSPGADPPVLLFETGSALRADRLGGEHAGALSRLWAEVYGGPPPRVRTRVCPAMKAAMEARWAAGISAATARAGNGGEARGRRRARG